MTCGPMDQELCYWVPPAAAFTSVIATRDFGGLATITSLYSAAIHAAALPSEAGMRRRAVSRPSRRCGRLACHRPRTTVSRRAENAPCGILNYASNQDTLVQEFLTALRELGRVEGRSLDNLSLGRRTIRPPSCTCSRIGRKQSRRYHRFGPRIMGSKTCNYHHPDCHSVQRRSGGKRSGLKSCPTGRKHYRLLLHVD